MLRYIAFILFMVGALSISGSGAYAQTQQDARQFVDGIGKKVLAVVSGNTSESQKQQQLRQMFSEHVDMEWMGRFVLGSAWQKTSEEQRQRYLQAYHDYLLVRYTTNFADYAGSRYAITGVKSESDGQFTVSMDITAPRAGEQNTQAGYRVQAAGGSFKIVDIIIEGVSLITTQRSEFASVAQKDGVDNLIKQLKEKASSEP